MNKLSETLQTKVDEVVNDRIQLNDEIKLAEARLDKAIKADNTRDIKTTKKYLDGLNKEIEEKKVTIDKLTEDREKALVLEEEIAEKDGKAALIFKEQYRDLLFKCAADYEIAIFEEDLAEDDEVEEAKVLDDTEDDEVEVLDSTESEEVSEEELSNAEENSQDEERVESKSKKGKYIAGTIGVLALAGIIGLSLHSCNKNKNKNVPNMPDKTIEATLTPTIAPTATPTEAPTATPTEAPVVTEAPKFTDINDEDMVAQRAEEVVSAIYERDPEGATKPDAITAEEVEEWIRWINGGIVKDATPKGALAYINRLEKLLSKENQMEVEYAFDYSKLFLDGSFGQKQAERIVELRDEILKYRWEVKGIKRDLADRYNDGLVNLEQDNGIDYIDQVSQDLSVDPQEKLEEAYNKFHAFHINTVYLNGTNGELSLTEVETKGMAATNMIAIMSTAGEVTTYEKDTLEGSIEKKASLVRIFVGGDEIEFNAHDVIDSYNMKNCDTPAMAEDGTDLGFNVKQDKKSNMINGMVRDAQYNKENNVVKALK